MVEKQQNLKENGIYPFITLLNVKLFGLIEFGYAAMLFLSAK